MRHRRPSCRHRHTGRVHTESLESVRARLRRESPCGAVLCQIQKTNRLPIDIRGLWDVYRGRVRRGQLTARSRTDPHAAMDLLVQQTTSRQGDLGVRANSWNEVYTVPAL